MDELVDHEVKMDLFSKGYDNFGQSPLLFYGSEANQKKYTENEAAVPANFIQSGDVVERLNVIDGYIQSGNFATGVSGWRIDSDGNIEANGGNFRGDITGASGNFTGDITGASGSFSGDISAATGTFSGTVIVGFDEILPGTSDEELNIGSGNVKLDGPNKRIIINDGENDRVLIGYLENGF